VSTSSRNLCRSHRHVRVGARRRRFLVHRARAAGAAAYLLTRYVLYFVGTRRAFKTEVDAIVENYKRGEPLDLR
jgi:hypothetical protein